MRRWKYVENLRSEKQAELEAVLQRLDRRSRRKRLSISVNDSRPRLSTETLEATATRSTKREEECCFAATRVLKPLPSLPLNFLSPSPPPTSIDASEHPMVDSSLPQHPPRRVRRDLVSRSVLSGLLRCRLAPKQVRHDVLVGKTAGRGEGTSDDFQA